MRTKALLLTAALSAAGVATSMAQVYSVNSVGYVNLSLGPGLHIIANPLNGTNNHLNTILPLATDDSQDGTTVFRYNVGTQNFADSATWLGVAGWLTADPDPNALVLNPGEGFFLSNIKSTAINVTFVGEVPQGTLHNQLTGGNNLQLRSSQVPQEASLGDTTTFATGTLQFPAVDGDTVSQWDDALQTFKPSSAYLAPGGTPIGWFSSDPSVPLAGPTIKVAEGFFVLKAGATSQDWTRTFSVN